jgi:predicted nucleotidyltransferase
MRQLIDGSAPRQVAPSLADLRGLYHDIQEICGRNGAARVRVFGSVARSEQDENSDVDLLVEFETGRSLFDLAALSTELEDFLGCPVNVVSEGALRQGSRFAQRVYRDAVSL